MVGRGTAGSLAAASVTRLHPDGDHELHHIYDSRIPVIGVGEGSWPSLVQELQQLTNLPHETVQQRLKGTRKYGVAFEGWGPAQSRLHPLLHAATGVLRLPPVRRPDGDLLHEGTRARHIDAKVLDITRVEGGAQVEFEAGRRSATTWSSMPAGFRGSSIPTGTSTYPSSPPTPPSSAAARRSSRKRGTGRLCNTRIPVRSRARTVGYSSSRSRYTHRTGTSSTAMFPPLPKWNRTSTRSSKPTAYRNSSRAPSSRSPISSTARCTTARWPASATRRPSWSPSKRRRSCPPSCRSGWSSTCGSTVRWSILSAMHRWSIGSSSATCSATACSSAGTTPAGPGTKANSGVNARHHAWPQHRKAADPEVVGCDALRKFDDMIALLNQPVIDKAGLGPDVRGSSHQLRPDVSGSRLLAPIPERHAGRTASRSRMTCWLVPAEHGAGFAKLFDRYAAGDYRGINIACPCLACGLGGGPGVGHGRGCGTRSRRPRRR